jgi:hypothetical protein
MNGNGNGTGDADFFEEEYDDRPLAIELTDRVIEAMGGSLDASDETEAAERVAKIYLRMLRLVREEQ